MKKENLQKLVLSAMFFALGLVLPLLTGQIREIGNMLLPMHLPVLLCGFICGWKYGGVVGFFLPLIRSLIFGMPVLYPNAVGMAFELLTYGLLAGLLFQRAALPSAKRLFASLIITVISGRVVWGIVRTIMMGLGGEGFSFAVFLTNGFVSAIPGLILQFTLIPAIILVLKKANLLPLKSSK